MRNDNKVFIFLNENNIGKMIIVKLDMKSAALRSNINCGKSYYWKIKNQKCFHYTKMLCTTVQ